ncbi:MAG: hypothetical protein AAB362_03350 [Patescibacteria group bacterium]
MSLKGYVRLPVKMVGLCRECGKEIDAYSTEKSPDIIQYKVDAHQYASKLCVGSNQLPAGKPMLRYSLVQSPENEPQITEIPKEFTLGF